MTVGHLLFAGLLTGYMAVAAIEERDLVAHFGSQYEDYRRRVPMFIPRSKPTATIAPACYSTAGVEQAAEECQV